MVNIAKPRNVSKKPEPSGIAFKCNFCDGGRTENRVGFFRVCSDEMIDYNIEKAHRIWCSSKDCPCRQYHDRKITRFDLDDIQNKINSWQKYVSPANPDGIVCYECRVFLDWKMQVGVVQNGADKGRPMHLNKNIVDNLAVLTTCNPDHPEKSRYIFAAFMIDECFSGNELHEGYVASHSDWRISLKPSEAEKIMFWKYYYNTNAPEKIIFGSGLFRYMSDIRSAQILRDIVNVKEDENEKKFAKRFFEHFCEVRGLNPDNIPEPDGGLYRVKDLF